MYFGYTNTGICESLFHKTPSWGSIPQGRRGCKVDEGPEFTIDIFKSLPVLPRMNPDGHGSGVIFVFKLLVAFRF
jgi:hypothetical protein